MNRPLTADERANKAIRESLTMARDDAAYHLRQVADILCAEGEHAAHARCHEEIRRRRRAGGCWRATVTDFDPGRELAPHITWGEMVATGHRSLADLNAEESEDYLVPLTVVAAMLSQVRQHFGAPLIVHSGFRCPSLNSAIGGAKTSQHMRGEAADFHVHGVELRAVFDWIRLESGLLYGQVILEGVQKGRPTWIHLSLGEPWRPAGKSRQALIMDGAGNYSVAK